MADPVRADLVFLHGLQQRRLCLGRCPVELVRQEDVGEHRPGPKRDASAVAVEDHGAGDVGGKQVGGELHPAEAEVERSGQRLGERGLAHSGVVLDQEVALGHEAAQRQAHRAVAAHVRAAHVGHDGVEGPGQAPVEVGEIGLSRRCQRQDGAAREGDMPGTTDGLGRSFIDAEVEATPSPSAAIVSLRCATIPASSADVAMAVSLGARPCKSRQYCDDVATGLRQRGVIVVAACRPFRWLAAQGTGCGGWRLGAPAGRRRRVGHRRTPL